MIKSTLMGLVLIALVAGCNTTLHSELPIGYEVGTCLASQRRGDCDNKAKCQSSYYAAMGLPHTFTIGRHNQGDKVYHAWNEWSDGTNRFVADPSAGFRGWIYKNPAPDTYIPDPAYQNLYALADAQLAGQ